MTSFAKTSLKPQFRAKGLHSGLRLSLILLLDIIILDVIVLLVVFGAGG